ncbi:MAG: hypothetical protein NZ853_08470 [Leptospiraceae bacterium]|nr:hypothetical protein [Leptospiraceae bacterium]MDW7976790.1 hypothetical protein [Leptospiraceae bacterium]
MVLIQSLPKIPKEMLKNLLAQKIEFRITGEEFLSKRGIIISNHLDIFDLLIPLVYLKQPLYLLYDEKALDGNLVSFVQRFSYFYFFSWMSEDKIEKTLLELTQNSHLFVFPERMPTKTGVIQPFDLFVFSILLRVCRKNELVLIPSGIDGTFRLSELSSLWELLFHFRKIRIDYHVGQPISVLESESDEAWLKQEVEKQVYSLSQHPERRKKGRILIKTSAREL